MRVGGWVKASAPPPGGWVAPPVRHPHPHLCGGGGLPPTIFPVVPISGRNFRVNCQSGWEVRPPPPRLPWVYKKKAPSPAAVPTPPKGDEFWVPQTCRGRHPPSEKLKFSLLLGFKVGGCSCHGSLGGDRPHIRQDVDGQLQLLQLADLMRTEADLAIDLKAGVARWGVEMHFESWFPLSWEMPSTHVGRKLQLNSSLPPPTGPKGTNQRRAIMQRMTE